MSRTDVAKKSPAGLEAEPNGASRAVRAYVPAVMVEELVPIFRVKDGYAAARWYARLGFSVEGEHRFAPGLPLYLFLRRGPNTLHLSEHRGDAPRKSLVYFYVDDVDSIASEFDVPVVEEPWAREVQLVDPDGNRLRIGQRRVAD